MEVDWSDLPDLSELRGHSVREFQQEFDRVTQNRRNRDLSEDDLRQLVLDRVLAKPISPRGKSAKTEPGPYASNSPAVLKDRYGAKGVRDGVFFIHQTKFKCRAYPTKRQRRHHLRYDGVELLVKHSENRRLKSWVALLGYGLVFEDVASIVRRAGFKTVDR